MSKYDIDDLTDDELQEAVVRAEKKRQKERIDDIKNRVSYYGGRGESFLRELTEEQLRKRNEEEERQKDLDIYGRNIADKFQAGAKINLVQAPSPLKCSKCSATYKKGDKVFKKMMDYCCPRCGNSLGIVKTHDPMGWLDKVAR